MPSMTKKIQVGDLVCCFRRREQGIGIALRVEDDFASATGFDGRRILKEVENVRNYQDRFILLDTFIHSSKEPDLVRKYYAFNRGYRKKLKEKFVLIQWLKKPSTHSSYTVTPDLEWLPKEWIKAIK